MNTFPTSQFEVWDPHLASPDSKSSGSVLIRRDLFYMIHIYVLYIHTGKRTPYNVYYESVTTTPDLQSTDVIML